MRLPKGTLGMKKQIALLTLFTLFVTAAAAQSNDNVESGARLTFNEKSKSEIKDPRLTDIVREGNAAEARVVAVGEGVPVVHIYGGNGAPMTAEQFAVRIPNLFKNEKKMGGNIVTNVRARFQESGDDRQTRFIIFMPSGKMYDMNGGEYEVGDSELTLAQLQEELPKIGLAISLGTNSVASVKTTSTPTGEALVMNQ